MGGWEWAILVLIALLLLGGSRLSGIGHTVGKAVREFSEEAAAVKPTPEDVQSPALAPESQPERQPELSNDVVDAEVIEPDHEPEPEPEASRSAERLDQN